MTYENKLLENYKKLLHASSSGKGLQELLKLGTEILENPVSVADTSFKVLGCFVPETSLINAPIDSEFYGKAALDSLNTGYLSPLSVKFVKDSKRYQQCVKLPGPHIVTQKSISDSGIQSPWSFLDCGIRIHGIFVAILTVADCFRPFTPEDIEYCRQLADFISIELQKNNFFIENHGIAYESLMNDLLNGEIQDHLQLRLRLQLVNRELKKNLYVVSLRRISENGTESIPPMLEQSLIRRFFPGSISVVYHNDIVLLVNTDFGPPLKKELEKEFFELVQTNHMLVGISEIFFDPSRTREYYQQTCKAISLGFKMQPSRCIYYYYQFSFFHAMEVCGKKVRIRDFCHPMIEELNRRNEKSDQELLKTLYVWLLYNRNVEKVTSVLHIHRSTLSYRIRKLKELLDSDLDDGDLIFQLMLSIKLIEYFSSFVDDTEHYWFKELQMELSDNLQE